MILTKNEQLFSQSTCDSSSEFIGRYLLEPVVILAYKYLLKILMIFAQYREEFAPISSDSCSK